MEEKLAQAKRTQEKHIEHPTKRKFLFFTLRLLL
jgi:hypothetical protein